MKFTGSGLQFCNGILITKRFYVSEEDGSKGLSMLFYAKVPWKVTLTTYLIRVEGKATGNS